MKPLLKIILILCFCLILFGCFDIPDSVQELETTKWEGIEYTLAYTVSGFHDKSVDLRIFKGKIKFDNDQNPIYDNVIYDECLNSDENITLPNIKSGNIDFKRKIINLFFEDNTSKKFEFNFDERQ